MKKLKSLLPGKARLFMRNINFLTRVDLQQLEWRSHMMDKNQRGLSQLVQMGGDSRSLLYLPPAHSEINKHEYKIFSQNGEDGILAWLISQVGSKSKTFVEFGIGSGRESITANLVLNFGWHGLMMDGSIQNIEDAKSFFKYLMPWSEYEKLDIRKEFVTRDNINDLIKSSKTGSTADLLSIDIDGNDYWLWEAITCINPRIVVMEYNATFGPVRSVTIPYKEDFDAYEEFPLGLYHGASVESLVKLGKKKGYRFVGCDTFGVNSFFVKEEFADKLHSPSVKAAFYDNQHKLKRGSQEVQFELIKDMPLVEI